MSERIPQYTSKTMSDLLIEENQNIVKQLQQLNTTLTKLVNTNQEIVQELIYLVEKK